MPFSFNLNFGKPKNPEAKNKNRPIAWFGLIRYIYPLTIIVIIMILIAFMGFLHNNVYLTMARAEIISNLKNTVSDEVLDSEKFYDVLAKMEVKSGLAIWPKAGKLTSPFGYSSSTAILIPIVNSTSTKNISTSTIK